MCFCIGQERDCQKGAATSLNAAVHPELNKEEFVYYSDCRPAQQTRDARYVGRVDGKLV